MNSTEALRPYALQSSYNDIADPANIESNLYTVAADDILLLASLTTKWLDSIQRSRRSSTTKRQRKGTFPERIENYDRSQPFWNPLWKLIEPMNKKVSAAAPTVDPKHMDDTTKSPALAPLDADNILVKRNEFAAVSRALQSSGASGANEGGGAQQDCGGGTTATATGPPTPVHALAAGEKKATAAAATPLVPPVPDMLQCTLKPDAPTRVGEGRVNAGNQGVHSSGANKEGKCDGDYKTAVTSSMRRKKPRILAPN